jgi:hypothetical protein
MRNITLFLLGALAIAKFSSCKPELIEAPELNEVIITDVYFEAAEGDLLQRNGLVCESGQDFECDAFEINVVRWYNGNTLRVTFEDLDDAYESDCRESGPATGTIFLEPLSLDSYLVEFILNGESTDAILRKPYDELNIEFLEEGNVRAL